MYLLAKEKMNLNNNEKGTVDLDTNQNLSFIQTYGYYVSHTHWYAGSADYLITGTIIGNHLSYFTIFGLYSCCILLR